ncbi:hypothetical protein PHYPSEUDO_013691 [Phytophthora pseudosyringae]|uniref:Uncharacterized protein n=1 Tax=Phytophthora pseudosyringae TaxID=221518 RepID=A0A8T1W1N9_9STRA|nr:hypothetical protein PHYPSEUDO_013691 [Phytophthora pseudosyringae]
MKRKRAEAEEEHGVEFVQKLLRSKFHHPLKQKRTFDLRLEPEEKTRLAVNGVVASQRFQCSSFGDIYYRLYSDDLPVFVTSDSILHAWHRSFDAFLVEMEEKCMFPALSSILKGGLSKCIAWTTETLETQIGVAEAASDVGDYLAMGLSLLRGQLFEGYEDLEPLWSAIQEERTVDVELFSTGRTVDFSQFKPRGHYTRSASLKCYFRAMMWLGRIDLRIAGGGSQDDDLHQLLCSVILVRCLQESDTLDDVVHFDSLLSSLVADGGYGADNVTVNELAQLIPSAMLAKVTDVAGDEERQKLLLDLQHRIAEYAMGTQIRSSLAPAEEVTPISFALLGQRFVWSAFIFSRLVGDHVVHNGVKQPRRVPSAVDIAFTLFGNNEAAQELAARMDVQTSSGDASDFVPHRDGIPFSSNLVALRQIIDDEFDNDSEEDSDVTSTAASVSTLWLRALRALSEPSPNTASTFHSDTWQRRQMNTQIASFTQLRHDTVLYATQMSTMKIQCEYPEGLVDPFPLFWQRMCEMALRMESIQEDAQALRRFRVNTLPRRESIFVHFASTVKTLGDIAECQATKKLLDEDQVTFMKSVMERTSGSGRTEYGGWYPKLFYDCLMDSCKRDVLVVDVHTDCPSPAHNDPGGVLHLGVGDPVVGFFIVNDVMYAGPLFSSYEFMTRIDQRLTDKVFKAKLPSMQAPRWAQQSYLCSDNLCFQNEENSSVEGSEEKESIV